MNLDAAVDVTTHRDGRVRIPAGEAFFVEDVVGSSPLDKVTVLDALKGSHSPTHTNTFVFVMKRMGSGIYPRVYMQSLGTLFSFQ